LKTIFFIVLTLLTQSLIAAESKFNFGVVVKNTKYQIYRSGKLGKKGLKYLKKELKNRNLPFPKTIIYMNDEGYNDTMKDYVVTKGKPLFALNEYKLQDQYGFKLFHSYDYNHRTYLDGRNPLVPTDDIDNGNNLGVIAQKTFGPNPNDGVDGGIEAFYRILDLMLDPNNQPVLFHCLGGKHRTGMMGLAIRSIQQGKWLKNAPNNEYTRAEQEYFDYNFLTPRKENFLFINEINKTERFQNYILDYKNELTE
jgi:hypothetical protein